MNQEIEQQKKHLLDLLVKHAFQYNEQQPFTLSSGKLSNYYLDCRKITLIPEGMDYIGQIILEKIKPLTIQGIGGLTLGADPIAYAVMAKAYQNQMYIKTFIIRKNRKGYGLQREVEGGLQSGDRVVVVDDVVTTGQSTITAIEKAKVHGLEVVKAIVLVDRQEEGGLQKIKATGVPIEALLSRDEIIDDYKSLHKSSK